MICKNCGEELINKDNYCPQCGMELSNTYSKPLKEKYIDGEYEDNQKNYTPNKNKSDQEYPSKDTDYDQNIQTLEEYESKEEGSGLFTIIILVLIAALLFGLLIGLIIFTGILSGLPKF